MEDSKEDIVSYNTPDSEKKTALKILSVEGVIILIIVAGIFFALNYFNIFPLSRISPALFGWLPVQGKNASESQPTPQDQNAPQGLKDPYYFPKNVTSFPCPIQNSDCTKDGQVIYDPNSNILGIAFRNVPGGTEISAMIPGTAKVVTDSNVAILITDETSNLQAAYLFKGESAIEDGDTVIQGDIIGTLSEGTIIPPLSSEPSSLFIKFINTETEQAVPIMSDNTEGLKINKQ